jgi:anhydro-N-acetylmuramic acid kinase
VSARQRSGLRPDLRSNLLVGLMSGTSLDGIDCALSDFSGLPALVATRFLPYPAGLRAALLDLSRSGNDELERASRIAVDLSELYAAAVNELLAETGIGPAGIAAIGCHGQTVRHRPELGFTVQLVNPALLAERTGITVVADFRSRDIAAGGQGAPLVPAFHAARFQSAERHRVVVNIGGIANLTDLPLPDQGRVRGFDCGPGNLLLDLWAGRHLGADCDRDGALAAAGTVIPELLARMLADEYFHFPPPKSTGRERFNAQWLTGMRADGRPAADVQATLAELTARTIAADIERWCTGAEEVFACGGGVHNPDLMHRLQRGLGARRLAPTDILGVPADWVEAMAFAWLARQTLRDAPGNLPQVTGAAGPRVLGAIYPA